MDKKKIIKEFSKSIREVSKNTSLIWAGIVGSFVVKSDTRDIDSLLIFEKLDSKQYFYVIKIISTLCEVLSNDKLEFVVEERNGPFKQSDKTKCQFHLIIQDKDFFDYTSKMAPLGYIEWTNNNLKLYGPNIFDLFEKKVITKDMLLNAKYQGINSSLKSLAQSEVYYSIYKIKGNKLKLLIKKKKSSKRELQDSIIGIVKANIRNFVKYSTRKLNPSLYEIDQIVKLKLPEYYDLIKEGYLQDKISKDNAIKLLREIKRLVE